MGNRRLTAFFFLLLGWSFVPATATAADYLASIGDTVSVSGGVVMVEAGDGFLLDTHHDRSYSCEGVPSDSQSEFGFNTELVGTIDNSNTITAVPNADMAPHVTGPLGGGGTARLSFVAVNPDRYRLSVATARTGGEDVAVRCFETTLFGGFNTYLNQYNYLELVNYSDRPISGAFVLTDNDHKERARLPFSVPGGSRVDFDLHGRVGRDLYGLVKVIHNGPVRALGGSVAFYSKRAPESTDIVLRGRFRLRSALN
ncbi:MAG: hypothetical protein KDD66_04210 [Bdellovibrionales bacterium]|nr:hypothetical protein [Bdellovibrionales bacterium]